MGQAVAGRAESRHGVFGVGTHLVAVPCSLVQEMFVVGEMHRPPGLGAYQRGVAVLRGRSLPAIDARACLGLPRALDELELLVQLLRDREKDHVEWLAELGASVAERRPFRLATDPRLCRFGKWYHQFQTDDPVLRSELARFERPHAEIHALAARVGSLVAEERHEEARALVEATRTGRLAELIALFESARAALRAQHREIGVALLLGGREVVLAVDRVEAIADLRPLPEGDDPIRTGALRAGFVGSAALWGERSEPVFVLDAERLSALCRG